MNNRSVCFFLLIIPAILTCGQRKPNVEESGIYIIKHYFYDPQTSVDTPSMYNEAKIWIKGNKSIQEIPQLNLVTAKNGMKTVEKSVKQYTYINYDKQVYYYFHNFSDTAKPFSEIMQLNFFKQDAGWNFYSKEYFKYDSVKHLTDTLINNTAYARDKYIRSADNNRVNFISYSLCNQAEYLIELIKIHDKKPNCSILRLDTFFYTDLVASTQILREDDSLTSEDLSVFNKWEKFSE